MKFKKITATVFAAVMLLSMCACEKGNMLDKYYGYDAFQYITLGQYENIVVEHESTAATEEEIEGVVDAFCNEYATWIDTDRTVIQKGDKVTIDYWGGMDGASYEGMHEDNVEFEVGSNTYYEGFENALIGNRLTDSNNQYDFFTVEVTFPEDYSSGGIAGKTVTYNVWVHKIKEKVIPEFTDELVNEKTEGKYPTMQSYKDYVAEVIQQKKQKNIDDTFATVVWNKVVNGAQIISYPEDRINYYKTETTSYLEQVWKTSTKLDYETFIEVYLGITYEEYLEQLQTKCEKLVKEELVLVAIAQEKGITLEWSDYKKRARNYLETYNCTSVHELEKVVSRSELCLTILNEDINEMILKTATTKVKD